jgi:hypothetical protein
MSFNPGDRIIVLCEQPGICVFCGQEADVRPYGPKGETLCYSCAYKAHGGNIEAIKEMAEKVLFKVVDEEETN